MSTEFFRKTLQLFESSNEGIVPADVKESPMMGQFEEEQIDELSKETLKSYAKKAGHDAMHHAQASGIAAGQGRWDSESHDKAFKRARGIDKALDRLEEEQVDELSPQTLGSYVKKAAHERGYHGAEAGRAGERRDRPSEREHSYRGEKRQRGIEKAISKMVGGPVDESSVKESINIGDIVKISTAPGMLSHVRVKAINEGQYTVATRSGTEYTVGYDDLWVKVTESKVAEADVIGLGEKSRQPKMPRGPVVEDELNEISDAEFKRKQMQARADSVQANRRKRISQSGSHNERLDQRRDDTDRKQRAEKKGQLDELSKDTMTSYIRKASRGAQDFSDVPDERKAGVHMALKKKHDMGVKVPATDESMMSEYGLDVGPGEDWDEMLDTAISMLRDGGNIRDIVNHLLDDGYLNPMDIRDFYDALKRKAQLNEKVDLGEKAVSKKQQRFMGMVHAAQKGEKPASKEVAKVAKSMKKSDVTDFAKTKHKGLPTKKKADECTSSGAVATAMPLENNEAKMGKIQYGKGVYESKNTQLENMIAEGMNISVNMGEGPDGQPSRNITITASDEDAVQLARLLNLAGLDSSEHEPAHDESDLDIEVVDENMPDWPTNPETSDDPFQYSGGLNKPKVTGQTTIPVVASQTDRIGRITAMEDVELERTLFKLYNQYKGE